MAQKTSAIGSGMMSLIFNSTTTAEREVNLAERQRARLGMARGKNKKSTHASVEPA